MTECSTLSSHMRCTYVMQPETKHQEHMQRQGVQFPPWVSVSFPLCSRLSIDPPKAHHTHPIEILHPCAQPPSAAGTKAATHNKNVFPKTCMHLPQPKLLINTKGMRVQLFPFLYDSPLFPFTLRPCWPSPSPYLWHEQLHHPRPQPLHQLRPVHHQFPSLLLQQHIRVKGNQNRCCEPP